MSKKVFISGIHEDLQRYLHFIIDWQKKGLLGQNIEITHETEDKRAEGDEAVRKHVKKKIEDAKAVIILIGNDTHNHDWIRQEAELANSMKKLIIFARLKGTTGGNPPIIANKIAVKFNLKNIKKKLDKI